MKILDFKKSEEVVPCEKIVKALESHLEDAKKGRTQSIIIISKSTAKDVWWCFLSAKRDDPGPMLKAMDMLKTQIHMELNARTQGTLLYNLLKKLGIDNDDI